MMTFFNMQCIDTILPHQVQQQGTVGGEGAEDCGKGSEVCTNSTAMQSKVF